MLSGTQGAQTVAAMNLAIKSATAEDKAKAQAEADVLNGSMTRSGEAWKEISQQQRYQVMVGQLNKLDTIMNAVEQLGGHVYGIVSFFPEFKDAIHKEYSKGN